MEMHFNFYDPTHQLKPFAYALPGDLPKGCALPDNALLAAPRLGDDGQPLPGEWPVLNAKGDGWDYAEDHRQRKDERDRIIEGTGTPYWLAAPLGEDDWQSPPHYMADIGPLPAHALLTPPPKPLATAQEEKRAEIHRAHESALAGAVALADPTPTTVAIESAMLAVQDPDGMDYVRGIMDARRAELLALVDAAATVGEVEGIVVSYLV